MFGFSMAEIQQISEYEKLKFTKLNRLAVYALDDLAFWSMHQFVVYREENKILPRVFRNKQEEIAWLNS